MSTDGWGAADLRREASYLSFARYDAREFDGAITRGIVEAYLGPSDTRSVLSVGAGAAELEAKLAADTSWNVRAIDVDDSVVSAVDAERVPANLTVATGDLREPRHTGHYDVNVAFGTLQELVGTPVEGLRGIRDSLRPGGLSLVVVPNLKDMVRIVDDERLVLDEVTDDVRLAYAELELENGDVTTQYGFTHAGQRFGDVAADGLGFDPATLTPLETLAERAGLRLASTEPLEEWLAGSGLPAVGANRPDGLDLDVGDGYPVSVPVDPGVLVGRGVERPFQDVIESFDRAAADAVASTIEERGLATYRWSQARDPDVGPRADLYAFRRSDRET